MYEILSFFFFSDIFAIKILDFTMVAIITFRITRLVRIVDYIRTALGSHSRWTGSRRVRLRTWEATIMPSSRNYRPCYYLSRVASYFSICKRDPSERIILSTKNKINGNGRPAKDARYFARGKGHNTLRTCTRPYYYLGTPSLHYRRNARTRFRRHEIANER